MDEILKKLSYCNSACPGGFFIITREEAIRVDIVRGIVVGNPNCLEVMSAGSKREIDLYSIIDVRPELVVRPFENRNDG